MLADAIQRFHQHRDQIAVGEQQDQQANNRRRDNCRAGKAGQAIHGHAGAVEDGVGGFAELFSAGTKRAAQGRGDAVRLLAIAVNIPLLRKLHLRPDAILQQRLPAGDHLGGNLGIHWPRRNRFQFIELAGHIVQRLLHRREIGRAARRLHVHRAAQAGDKAEILIVPLAQYRHLFDQLPIHVITVRNA
ncbi:hypothetical protein D3C75_415340 [compost metagenome]